MEHGSILNDIAICIMAAWLFAVVAQIIKQPLIIAYLAAGFVIGPEGIKLVEARSSIETISEVGLILLLFMIGLEIDLKKILGAGKLITLTALSQIFGGFLLGLFVFSFFDLPVIPGKLDVLYLAVAAALSSTVIIVKLLYDRRELDTLPGRITLGVLILQDLAAILFLALQPNLQHPEAGPLLKSVLKVVVLMVVAFTASRYALPHIFRLVARLPEMVLVGALAWCFIVAGFASVLGLSREMGALVAGVAISTFPYALDVTAKVGSLRDFFVTLFFVSLGMSIPPPTLYLVGWALVLCVFIVFSRFITVFPPLHKMEQGHRASLLPAIHLCQISEFSLVILALGRQADHITEKTVGIVAYAFVILAVASTYGIVRSNSIVSWISTRLSDFKIPDLDEATGHFTRPEKAPTIYLLGFAWTASSLIEEIQRQHPAWVDEIAVVDFNPDVIDGLRHRGVRVMYGDIAQRDTLLHAGIDEAEIIICTLPNTILKGATNLRVLQQIRELNSSAQIVMHAELIEDVPRLRAAGADYVHLPRLLEARDLTQVIDAARKKLLADKRHVMEHELKGRREVIP